MTGITRVVDILRGAAWTYGLLKLGHKIRTCDGAEAEVLSETEDMDAYSHLLPNMQEEAVSGMEKDLV